MYSPFIRITGKGPQMLMRTSKIRSEKPAHRRVFSFCQTCKVHYISMPESCQTNGSGITLHGLSLVTVQALLKTMRLLCITASVGRSRSVKNAADTKLFAAPGLAKSKYRRFSRPTSTAMHKRRSKNQVGLNCNFHCRWIRDSLSWPYIANGPGIIFHGLS